MGYNLIKRLEPREESDNDTPSKLHNLFLEVTSEIITKTKDSEILRKTVLEELTELQHIYNQKYASKTNH